MLIDVRLNSLTIQVCMFGHKPSWSENDRFHHRFLRLCTTGPQIRLCRFKKPKVACTCLFVEYHIIQLDTLISFEHSTLHFTAFLLLSLVEIIYGYISLSIQGDWTTPSSVDTVLRSWETNYGSLINLFKSGLWYCLFNSSDR